MLRMDESLVRYTLDRAFVVSTERTVLLKGVQRDSVDERMMRVDVNFHCQSFRFVLFG